MATVAIGSLRYDVIADTVQFEQGMVATRKELRQAEKAFRASMTPAQKYGFEVQRLSSLLKKGAIDEKTYAASLQRAKLELQQQTGWVSKATVAQAKLNAEVEEYARAQSKAAAASKARMSATPQGGGGGIGGMSLGRLAAVAVGAQAALSSLRSLTSFVGSSVDEFAKFQMAAADFKVLTGSVERGNELIAEFRRLAAETPLGINQVTSAAQTLLSFGVDADTVTESLERLGDISGGNAERFKSLALVYGQVTAAQRLTGQDLLQFINAGWNPLLEISEATGKSVADLKDQMSEGGVSIAMVEDAMKRATSEGGKFNERMKELSGTLVGQQQILDGNISKFKASFGGLVAPVKQAGIEITNTMFEYVFQPIADFGENVSNVIAGTAVKEAYAAVGREAEKAAPQVVELSQAVIAASNALKLEAEQAERDSPYKDQLQELRERSLELQKGAEWMEEYRLLNSGANKELIEAIRLEKEKVAELEKQAAVEKQMQEERKRVRLEAQKDQVEAAEEQLKAFDAKVKDAQSKVSIGDIGSFSSGSTGEYKFLQAEQRRRQEASEVKRIADEANRKRQQLLDEVTKQTGFLEQLRDKLETTQGVG